MSNNGLVPLIPENSYLGKCSCGKEFLAPKYTLHCHKCLYAEIEALKAQLGSNRKLFSEMSDYLDINNLTNIGHKSVFHNQMKELSRECGRDS